MDLIDVDEMHLEMFFVFDLQSGSFIGISNTLGVFSIAHVELLLMK